jgi:hypothetical protein
MFQPFKSASCYISVRFVFFLLYLHDSCCRYDLRTGMFSLSDECFSIFFCFGVCVSILSKIGVLLIMWLSFKFYLFSEDAHVECFYGVKNFSLLFLMCKMYIVFSFVQICNIYLRNVNCCYLQLSVYMFCKSC